MQRLLSLKQLLSSQKNPKNLSNTITSSYIQHSLSSSKTLLSLSKTNPIPLLHPSRHFFSHSTSSPCSSYYSWGSPNALYRKIQGFLSNPIILKQVLLPTALLKAPIKSLLRSRVGILRIQFSRRNFQLNRSFDAHRRSWQSQLRRFTPDDVVLGLILANVAVFMLWGVADREFMKNNFMISLDNFKNGRVHTMITSAFSHIEVGHIISNMIGLYFFGTSIARYFGPEYLLKLYLSGAVAGSVFYLVHHAFMSALSEGKQMWSHDPSRTPGLGASGAVNAIMLLDIFLFPKKTLYLEFIIPVPAILLGIFLIGSDLLRILEGDSQISGSAHLGGAAVAAVAWARLRRGHF